MVLRDNLVRRAISRISISSRNAQRRITLKNPMSITPYLPDQIRQTRAIHVMQRQRQTLEGLLADVDRGAVTGLHRAAQRLLRPLKVVNPYAADLSFADEQTRTRRDHMKYLGLISSIALLHQYSREVKRVEHQGRVIEYVEVWPKDIALANKLSSVVLGRTLDELPPQTRKLLIALQDWIRGRADELCPKVGDGVIGRHG